MEKTSYKNSQKYLDEKALEDVNGDESDSLDSAKALAPYIKLAFIFAFFGRFALLAISYKKP